MKYLDLTFDDPASNLACDEALLELFEIEPRADSLLRVWEPTDHFVVLGHSNRLHAEANLSACKTDGVSILRRVSGGGAVVQGMAAVVTVISALAGLLAFIGYAAEQHLAAQGKAIDWALFLARSPQILISAREDSLFSLAGGIFGAVYAIKRARHPEFVPLRSPEKSSAGGNLLPG